MVNFNPYTSLSYGHLEGRSVSATGVSPVLSDVENTPVVASTTSRSAAETVSTLARQLSDAAMRAESRVVQQGSNLLDSITGENYIASKAQHDAEAPVTDDPGLLARARQATGFLNGTDVNPFKDLAREQLSLIAHDDGGTFTINERRAAWVQMQPAVSPTAAGSRPVPGNGRDLMIARLFGHDEPPVAQPPATYENAGRNIYEFLTREDRGLISDMFAYAQEQGADPAYVEQLARSLGSYRRSSDGRQQLSSNNGYDAQRYRVTFNFKQEDAATASRILSGTAINSTRLDQGYLRHILNPDYGALSNIGGIPFLEKMVNRFSDEGVKQTVLGDEFTTFKVVPIEDNIVITTDKSIRLPPSESLAENIDGVWTLTEKGQAAGYTIDQATGVLNKPVGQSDIPGSKHSDLGLPTGAAREGTILNALSHIHERPSSRWVWPSHLFDLIKNFKP